MAVLDGTAHKEHLSISLVKRDRHYRGLLVDFFPPCFFIVSPKGNKHEGFVLLYCVLECFHVQKCTRGPYRTSFRISLRFIL